MAKKTIKVTGKGDEVNGEGDEKVGSTTKDDLATYSLNDSDVKIRGLAAGYRESQRTK